MEIVEKDLNPSQTTHTIYGDEERTIEFDSKVKIQFTGPGSETLFNDGPAEGKKWRVFIQLHINESDA